jgi:hypothetical protein
MTDSPSAARRPIAIFFLITALLAVLGMRYEYGRKPWMEPVRGDGRGYYAYLPNYLLYGDPSLESVARAHYEGAYPDSTGVRRFPETGRWLDQYNLGEALMMLPFFAAGHLVAKLRGLPLDGYSAPYQWGAALSGTFYFLLGLYAVRRMLAGRHDGRVILATLVALAFGTNLFHHGTRDSIYSHAYTFCLVALLCLATAAWHRAATLRATLALGLVMGLIALVRLPNGIAALIPALWGLQSPRELPARAKFLLARWKSLALAVAVAFVVFAPQLAVWRYATGHWLVNTYAIYAVPGRKAWDFLHPRVFSLLFSVKKGLFFWSPLLLIAAAGFVALRRARSEYIWPALLTLAAQTWIMGAWVFWDYGGSYGHRGYTDWLALFAPPLAMAIERARRSRFADLFWCALWATVFLSVYQMLQYWHEMIPSEGPTWAQYRALFLNF